VFNHHQSREKAFDATIAELYCGSAVIRNVRTYPDGTQRTLALPASRYQARLSSAMPLARAKGPLPDEGLLQAD
jgi:hypothetical protein